MQDIGRKTNYNPRASGNFSQMPQIENNFNQNANTSYLNARRSQQNGSQGQQVILTDNFVNAHTNQIVKYKNKMIIR